MSRRNKSAFGAGTYTKHETAQDGNEVTHVVQPYLPKKLTSGLRKHLKKVFVQNRAEAAAQYQIATGRVIEEGALLSILFPAPKR